MDGLVSEESALARRWTNEIQNLGIKLWHPRSFCNKRLSSFFALAFVLGHVDRDSFTNMDLD